MQQGKEIIEFYLKELEDEGIEHVPRWVPSSIPQSVIRPSSLSTSPPLPPNPASIPSVCVSLPSESKDGSSQDSKQDGGTSQADSLAEILVATPEGVFSTQQSQQLVGQRLTRVSLSHQR